MAMSSHATIVGKSNHASDIIFVKGWRDLDTIVGKTTTHLM
jgi:hypothetical protein